jgi:glycosyltransferase involved in cell wall biosynthesis
MEKLSVVVSVFNEEEAVPYFYKEATKAIENIGNVEYEIIFVDDGSTDNTLEIVKELRRRDESVKYISFSRNFGKESAMFAGLEKATGDYVSVMDVDLQDPPSMLKEMLETLRSGEYDCVATRRATRKNEPKIRSLFAKAFYKIINNISKTEMVDGARDFRLMTRQMTDEILRMKEYNRYSKGIFSWVGFRVKWLSYDNVERVAGKTKWSFWKLFKYAIDGIIGFSTAPLRYATLIGLFFCVVAFVFIAIIITKTLLYGESVQGYPSTICIILFVSGVQLLSIGIIGEYISKIYLEVKKRPIYIVKDQSEK